MVRKRSNPIRAPKGEIGVGNTVGLQDFGAKLMPSLVIGLVHDAPAKIVNDIGDGE